MKKIPVVAIVFCLFLTSCNSRFTAGVDKEYRYFDKYELADIKNISEIKDLLDDSERYGLYSELEDNKDILYYFDLLDDDEYVEVQVGSSDYVLFYYTVTGYGKKIVEISDIKSDITDSCLSVGVNSIIYDGPGSGCFPQTDRCRCIVKIKGDFNSLYVNGSVYRPFDGGIFRIGDKAGIVDPDLNVKVSPIYDWIRIEEIPEQPHFYLMETEEGYGILNKDYDIICDPDVVNYVFLEDDSLIETVKDNDQYFIYKKDLYGNILQGPLKGVLDLPETNHYGQHIFTDGLKKGVMDEDLNVIIEPLYQSINSYYSQRSDTLLAVMKDNKVAVFDHEGNQKTEFKYDSIYEAVSAYNKETANP